MKRDRLSEFAATLADELKRTGQTALSDSVLVALVAVRLKDDEVKDADR